MYKYVATRFFCLLIQTSNIIITTTATTQENECRLYFVIHILFIGARACAKINALCHFVKIHRLKCSEEKCFATITNITKNLIFISIIHIRCVAYFFCAEVFYYFSKIKKRFLAWELHFVKFIHNTIYLSSLITNLNNKATSTEAPHIKIVAEIYLAKSAVFT